MSKTGAERYADLLYLPHHRSPRQPRAALDEGVIAELDTRIGQLRARIGTQPAVEITYFVADEKKTGGAYITVHGRVCKIRALEKQIVLEDNAVVPVEQIMALRLL